MITPNLDLAPGTSSFALNIDRGERRRPLGDARAAGERAVGVSAVDVGGVDGRVRPATASSRPTSGKPGSRPVSAKVKPFQAQHHTPLMYAFQREIETLVERSASVDEAIDLRTYSSWT